jgi:hypothetical protein
MNGAQKKKNGPSLLSELDRNFAAPEKPPVQGLGRASRRCAKEVLGPVAAG